MPSPLIYQFKSKATPKISEVGGKALSLMKMTQANFVVPNGFVMTVEFFKPWFEQVEKSTAWKNFIKSTESNLKKNCDELKTHCKTFKMTTKQKETLSTAMNNLSKKALFAVRSSSPEEDLKGTSFAGGYETTLGVTKKTLEKAILNSFISAFDERIVRYKMQHKMKTDKPRIAVIVQEQIDSDTSGVAFSLNPQNNCADEAIINSNFGLGETVVAGLITPDTYIVNKPKKKILEKIIANKDHALWLTPKGGTEKKENINQKKASLTDKQVKEVAKLAEDTEKHYKTPMDIEWAYAKAKLYLLQARPITAYTPPLNPYMGQKAEWISDDPEAILARASIVELLPDPLSPFYESVAKKAVIDGINGLMDELIALNMLKDWKIKFSVINGYGYYQMTLTLWNYIKIIPKVFKVLPWMFKQSVNDWKDIKTPKFLKLLDKWKDQDIKKMTYEDLLEGGRKLTAETQIYYTATQAMLPIIYMGEATFMMYYNWFVRRKNDPPFETFVMGYDSTPIYADKSLYDIAIWTKKHKKLAEVFLKTANEDFTTLLNRKTPPKGVENTIWKEWQKHFQKHLENYGHLIYDLDVAKAVPADNPEPLFGTMKYYMSGKGVNPYTRQEKTIKERESATKKLLRRLGFIRRHYFKILLRFAQGKVPYREDGLASIGLAYPTARKLLLELGERLKKKKVLKKKEEIFWLKANELKNICKQIDANKEVKNQNTVISDRKNRWEWQRTLTPKPMIAKGWLMKKTMQWYFPEHSSEEKISVMKGLGVSKGKVTGTARVILSPDEFDQMQPGDILVTAITTPAWTPLFALASGVVTDVGGALSHSSIVAREYGIPAVLGTGVASKQIKSGQLITVDGDKGEVRI